MEAITPLIAPIRVNFIRNAFGLAEDKGIVARFPRAVLQLVEEATDLSDGPPTDLAEFLDEVAAGDPALVKDWRFRRLKSATRGD